MIRTQVYLDDHQVPIIKLLAKTHNKSEAQILREIVDLGISELKKEGKGNAAALLEFAKLGKKLNAKGAPSDLSIRIDDYLYGDAE